MVTLATKACIGHLKYSCMCFCVAMQTMLQSRPLVDKPQLRVVPPQGGAPRGRSSCTSSRSCWRRRCKRPGGWSPACRCLPPAGRAVLHAWTPSPKHAYLACLLLHARCRVKPEPSPPAQMGLFVSPLGAACVSLAEASVGTDGHPVALEIQNHHILAPVLICLLFTIQA